MFGKEWSGKKSWTGTFKPGCEERCILMQECFCVVEFYPIIMWCHINIRLTWFLEMWKTSVQTSFPNPWRFKYLLKFYAKSLNTASATVIFVSYCITKYETETLPRFSNNPHPKKKRKKEKSFPEIICDFSPLI